MDNQITNEQFEDAIKLQHLIKVLLNQYQLLGEQDKEISPEKMIDYIVNYYQDIINCMPGNVYWLNKNCVTVGCNQNVLTMFGFKSVADFKGLSFEDMGRVGNWTPQAIQSFKTDTLDVIKTGKSKLNIEEPPIPHHDGRIIYFLTSRVPLFSQNGNIIGIIGISIDITELKNTQAELKKAKEQAEAASLAKSEFIANMSHDVKTPLTGIIGIAELLTDQLKDENHEFVQILLMSGRQLLNFFDNCLEIFKMENNDIALVAERFNLKTVLDEIYDLYQPAINTKNLSFNIYYDQPIPDYLIGSRSGLYRVLLNLVGNAVKFTHEGSVTMTVTYSKKSATREAIIKLTVEDTGIGIPRDKQKIIFDHFTRLIPSYKGTYEGSGIGLYIVQKFMKMMQGEIYVKSEEGKGSQFTILLPLTIPLLSEQEYEEIAPQIPFYQKKSDQEKKKTPIKKNGPVKILLVEDNVTVQRIQNFLLSSMNCDVDTVNSGEKALEIFKPGKYDLIFMDIGLPGIQGDVVSRHIRMEEEGHNVHVPIIALTAHTTDDIDNRCNTAGIEDVFSKPLSREQVKEIIEEYYLG